MKRRTRENGELSERCHFQECGKRDKPWKRYEWQEYYWIMVNRDEAARSVLSHHFHPTDHSFNDENENGDRSHWKVMVGGVRPQLGSVERPGRNGRRESVGNDER